MGGPFGRSFSNSTLHYRGMSIHRSNLGTTKRDGGAGISKGYVQGVCLLAQDPGGPFRSYCGRADSNCVITAGRLQWFLVIITISACKPCGDCVVTGHVRYYVAYGVAEYPGASGVSKDDGDEAFVKKMYVVYDGKNHPVRRLLTHFLNFDLCFQSIVDDEPMIIHIQLRSIHLSLLLTVVPLNVSPFRTIFFFNQRVCNAKTITVTDLNFLLSDVITVFIRYNQCFAVLIYNTLFPRIKQSPYLFFSWPSTYSCNA